MKPDDQRTVEKWWELILGNLPAPVIGLQERESIKGIIRRIQRAERKKTLEEVMQRIEADSHDEPAYGEPVRWYRLRNWLAEQMGVTSRE